MKLFSNQLLLIALAALPALVLASDAQSSNPLAGHWDSVFFVALGSLIVWREVGAAKQGKASQRRSGWSALDSWRRPARERPGLWPVLANLVLRRFRR